MIARFNQGFSALGEQIHHVKDFSQRKVNAIGIVCVDSKGIIPVIQKANKASIPVLAMDTGVDGGQLGTFIATTGAPLFLSKPVICPTLRVEAGGITFVRPGMLVLD